MNHTTDTPPTGTADPEEDAPHTTPVEPDSVDPSPSPTRRRPSRRALAAALVLTFGAAGLAAGGYFGWQNHQQRARDSARDSARDAACSYGSVLANYDAKSLDSYFTAVLARATGEWKQEFETTSKDLRDVLTQGQVHSTTGTIQCAIGSNTGSSAEAIVVIDQSVSSVGTQSQPQRGQLAITLTLSRSGGEWLVDKVSSPLLRAP